MRVCLLLLALIAHSYAYSPDLIKVENIPSLKQEQFAEFVKEHNKEYATTDEYFYRLKVYVANQEIINELNSDPEDDATYGYTEFADMTPMEFKNKYLLKVGQPPKHPLSKYLKYDENAQNDAPDEFNWVDHGLVTDVKNQGSVGSCWAFSTVGNIEGQWAKAGHDLTSLSVEQLVECDSTTDPDHYPNADCGVFGGWPYLAMKYILRVGGIASNADYPYCVGIGGKDSCYPCSAPGYNETLCGPGLEPPMCNDTKWYCRQSEVKFTAKISDWKAISEDEDVIKQQLYTTGPFSVALDAQMLQFYKKGIFSPRFCSKTSLDHAVLMTGYGVQPKSTFKKETPFWIVKNSWGEKWGEKGYFRIKRGTGQCGINTQVITSLVGDSFKVTKMEEVLN